MMTGISSQFFWTGLLFFWISFICLMAAEDVEKFPLKQIGLFLIPIPIICALLAIWL